MARFLHVAWLVIPLLACLGCGGRAANPERYVPKPEAARDALSAALTAWQAGQPVGPLTTTSPRVNVVDSHRRQGQELRSFEILGEVPGAAARCFAVRLSLENPREEQKARYVVVGLDPLWVFRHEDFEMMTHWEHPMNGPTETKPATGK